MDHMGLWVLLSPAHLEKPTREVPPPHPTPDHSGNGLIDPWGLLLLPEAPEKS